MVESPARLGDWLRGAAARLHLAGISEPAREARLLWSAASGTDLARFQLSELALDDATVVTLGELLDRRLSGEPIAHVTGLAGFRRLLLRSDRRALIPRPETEGLVELLLSRVTTGRVADLGTGSGCIALSLADEGRFDQVVAVDRSRDALALAAENRNRIGLAVHLVAGDWYQPLRGLRFDALMSNPPYLTDAEYAALEPAVRDYEPRDALASGADGLAATRLLLREGRSLLRDGGWLGLELDCRRADAAAGIARDAGYASITLHQDLFGRERFLFAQRSDGQ